MFAQNATPDPLSPLAAAEKYLQDDLGVRVIDLDDGADIMLVRTADRYRVFIGPELPPEKRLVALEGMATRVLWEAPDRPWRVVGDDEIQFYGVDWISAA